jgi:hypothetical protein
MKKSRKNNLKKRKLRKSRKKNIFRIKMDNAKVIDFLNARSIARARGISS